MPQATQHWCALVPVKRLSAAKSRLDCLRAADRADLALAFCTDVIAALRGSPLVEHIAVITGDAAVAGLAATAGCEVVADPHDRGINQALHRAALSPGPARHSARLAVFPADLAAMRPADVTAVLTAAARHQRAFVADRRDDGTTVLTAALPAELVPAFGPGSARRHLASGARELAFPVSSRIRLDVDTCIDLVAAIEFGLGPAARTVLARATGPSPCPPHGDGQQGRDL